MAVAHDVVKLRVGHFEEPFGFPIGVVFQTLGAQHWVFGRHAQGRAGATHGSAYFWRLIFGAGKRQQQPIAPALEELGPAQKALLFGHRPRNGIAADVRDSFQFIQCLMPHGNLQRKMVCPAPIEQNHTPDMPMGHSICGCLSPVSGDGMQHRLGGTLRRHLISCARVRRGVLSANPLATKPAAAAEIS